MFLSRATGSVSSGNLSAFDVIGGKVQEIAGDDIVTIGSEESFPSNTIMLSPKLCHQLKAPLHLTRLKIIVCCQFKLVLTVIFGW